MLLAKRNLWVGWCCKVVLIVTIASITSACLVALVDRPPIAAQEDTSTPEVFMPLIKATTDPAQAVEEQFVDDVENVEESMLVEEVIGTNSPNAEVSVAANKATYYVDCTDGNDDHNGRSQERAWRSIEKANQAPLSPGDRLRFKRGCSWHGPLEAAWTGTADSPILIGSYGTGGLPQIQNAYSSNVSIRGSYQIIENLHATLSSPPNPDPNCNNQPVGWKAGFTFQAGSAHNIVQNSEATKLAIGIFFHGDSHHNKALNNSITGNHVVWELTPDRTLGAMGVLLQGNGHEVAFNYFANNKTICTYTGVIESNSIELYAATNARIHHNQSFGDRVFSEMGSSSKVRSENNTYAYNLHVTSLSDPYYGARFVVTRGWNHIHGPVLGTLVVNNTLYLTGDGSKGVVCEKCGNGILTLENNIMWVNREPFSSDGPFNENHNIFWSGSAPTLLNIYGFSLSGGSEVADPQFFDAANQNFRLRAKSPAINRGTRTAVEAGYDFDLAQTNTRRVGDTDIGAYEYRQEPWHRIFKATSQIEAEDYRAGGYGSGFVDSTPGNTGGAYRSEGVDILSTRDSSGHHDVGWIDADEWLAYDILVEATGTYRMVVRASTPSSNRRFRIEVNGENVSGSVTIPWSGGWNHWVDVPVIVPLKAGRRELRIVAETDRFDLNYFSISKLQ